MINFQFATLRQTNRKRTDVEWWSQLRNFQFCDRHYSEERLIKLTWHCIPPPLTLRRKLDLTFYSSSSTTLIFSTNKISIAVMVFIYSSFEIWTMFPAKLKLWNEARKIALQVYVCSAKLTFLNSRKSFEGSF